MYRCYEDYTSFSRWRNAIARSTNNLNWSVAKRSRDLPSWIWVDDLWGSYKDRTDYYTFAVSESPDGTKVAVHIWKGDKLPLKSLAEGIVPKGEIMSVIEDAKGKVPDKVYKELVKTFSTYRLM